MNQDIDYSFAAFFPDNNIRPFAYLLSQRLREGHVCIPVNEEPQSTPFGNASLATLQMASPKMWTESGTETPFVYEKGYLYLQRYYQYETRIIEKLRDRVNAGKEKRKAYGEKILNQKSLVLQKAATNPLDGLSADEKTDWQLVAALRALLNEFSIITGGPGTGKTTTLAKFLHLLFSIEPGSRVALAAPTGKASMRMLESLREQAKQLPSEIQTSIHALNPYTLHRLLGYRPNSIYFKHNAENPLPFDWIVVDEASMIDMPLFSKLLDACDAGTRLLLLGDKDQLASVEAGSLLGDLCLSAGTLNRFLKEENEWLNDFIPDAKRRIPESYASMENTFFSNCITELRYSYRFKQQGAIGQLSLSIIKGLPEQTLELLDDQAQPQVALIGRDADAAFTEFVSGYLTYMEEPDPAKALANLQQLRVLVTVREGESGLYQINRKIEKILQALRPDLLQPNQVFYHNRPVIVTGNNYELGLFNGDIGLVRRDPDTRQLKVYFEPEAAGKPLRRFIPASLNDCETVFAMTIHKSQGSEFKKVMVVLPDQSDNPLLTRELIYTGVTRSKEEVLIRGTRDGLEAGIRRQVVRISGIHKRAEGITTHK
ncbi:MAG: exodeoxyribonuclease V subunit alpha [Bacteroidetes bacterium]|nr:exodeoxyribonuclease V subunit alpha [Bacteroidota bacterium]